VAQAESYLGVPYGKRCVVAPQCGSPPAFQYHPYDAAAQERCGYSRFLPLCALDS
jgi:hypothetical protein